jgi:iron only hydrogenase large subunit-like protein/nitrogen-specific signal transduction histidine kinase
MIETKKEPLVKTIKEKCRVCYSCVRECPAKAIRIINGQADVLAERCIGCANCVRVCSQQAKLVRNSITRVKELLSSGAKTAACIAPSFPAEFSESGYRKVAGMIRALGFSYVVEVSFGADLVSHKYKSLLDKTESQYIATTCPAIVLYVEKYHPSLVKKLAPIASPMVACARVIHKLYGEDTAVVFIGPCVAKKEEAEREDIRNDVNEVLTFAELREMFRGNGISFDSVAPSNFDPPHPGTGTIYPIGRGMLQASNLEENLLKTDVFATDGTKQFVAALKEFDELPNEVRLLEVLCCNGCIMGSGMTTKLSHFNRRAYVSNYARSRLENLDRAEWETDIEHLKGVDLRVNYQVDDMRLPDPTEEELKKILEQRGKTRPEDELNCGACGYDTCAEHAIAIYRGLAEIQMCLPFTIETLKRTTEKLTWSYEQMVNTKNALVQSEKLASLGRLAAGIAHEINNPLTGVLSFSSILAADLKDTIYKDDLQTIVKETIRCREIVQGILDFARTTKLEKESTSINRVIEDSLRILQNHMKFQNIKISTQFAENIPALNLDVIQMRSVVNNLCMNAADAMHDRGEIIISTWFNEKNGQVFMSVSDTGVGISQENMKHIFDPFFTTKEIGKGTGLGLSVTYGIIETHNGAINVESKEGAGTTFTIMLPLNHKEKA